MALSQQPVKGVQVQRFGPQTRENLDLLAVEEPLEIRLEFGKLEDRQQKSIAVTMRTPGNDLALAAGFLYAEGILEKLEDIHKIDHCGNVKKPEEFGNVVKVELKPSIQPNLEKLERNFYMSSSCGVCGKASIEAIGLETCKIVAPNATKFQADLILKLPAIADAQQAVFRHTGALHAASIFDAAGNLLVQMEDVGRHNALDKAIGSLFFAGKLPLDQHILLLSGRTGFELVQKAAMAGISCMAAVGAPTSLAVELAQSLGITLIGFLRGDRFNVYSGEILGK